MDVADIISELDDHGFDDTESARKVAIINDVMWEVCGLEPWPFLESTASLTFDGTHGYPVELDPTDPTPTITDLHAVLSIRQDNGGPLDYIDFDEFQQNRPDTLVSGTPRWFYFEAGVLTVYPIPPSTTTATLSYISTPAALTSASLAADIPLPAQYHRAVLVNGALVRLYAMEEDLDIAAGFKAYHDEAVARMREFMWRRQYQRQMIVVPSDVDDTDDLSQ